MSNYPPPGELIDPQAACIWCDDATDTGEELGPRVRLFRRTFELEARPARAALRLYAEMRYGLFVNGRFVGRGPQLHHAMVMPLDEVDLTPYLKAGQNVLAVAVIAANHSYHNHVPTGTPGLLAELDITDLLGQTQTTLTDEHWRVTAQTGWRRDVPRRSGAIDYIEVCDMAVHPYGWRDVAFDDSNWEVPSVDAKPWAAYDPIFCLAPQPAMTYGFAPVAALLQTHEIADPPVAVDPDGGTNTYGRALMDQAWLEDATVKVSDFDGDTGGCRVGGLTSERGAVLVFDLGAEYAGQVVLEMTCEPEDGEAVGGEASRGRTSGGATSGGGGVVDVAWAEFFDDERPTFLLKGNSYVDQLQNVAGEVSWHPIQFSAGRYVVVILRGFEGAVTIKRCGMVTSEPDVMWQGKFATTETSRRLSPLWELCRRTLAVGTQESLMDCPTREQAAYLGDGHPVARWITHLTGDVRFWKYLVTEQFRRPAANGLIRSTVFSGQNDTLIDYNLLAIIGTRDYHDATGDDATVAGCLDACDGILAWFERQQDERGLFNWHWQRKRGGRAWEPCYTPDYPHIEDRLNLFIDHSGMGWHNDIGPGLDRRGINAAINALLIQTRDALADLHERLGSPQHATELRETAAKLRPVMVETFFDSERGVFIDGELEGQQLERISEHTNVWTLLAGCCDAEQARTILEAVFDSSRDDVARGGPYFWYYSFEALAQYGLAGLAMARIERVWGPMMDRGATTLFETTLGDEKDTACHPWSGPPVQFLLEHIAGLPSFAQPGDTIELKPRYDLLPDCHAKIITAAGPVSIQWQRQGETVTLEGSLPHGVKAKLGEQLLHGAWRVERS